MPLWEPYQSKPPLGAVIDWTRPLAPWLAAFWLLNEGAGVPHEAASGRGATSNSATWSGSPFGQSLAFNGTSQYVNLGTVPALNVAGPITVAILASPAVQATNAFDNHNAPTNTAGWMLGFHTTANTEIDWYIGTTNTTATSTSGAVDGNLHVFSVSQSSTSAGGVQFYRDGVPWGTATQASFPTANTTNASLGARIDGTTRFLSGRIVWAFVLSRALSAGEHAAIGASPTAIFPMVFGSPRAYYLMEHAAAGAAKVPYWQLFQASNYSLADTP